MLHETCMLVDLSISLPPQSKIAKRASEEVEARYRTARKQGKVTKQLFSQQHIKPLLQAANALRAKFDAITLPYNDAYHIIPTENYFKFTEEMRSLMLAFDDRKHEFLTRYEWIRSEASKVLGELYDPKDYPDPQELNSRIRANLTASVLPAVTAFDSLAGLTPEAVEELKEQALTEQKEKIEEALFDLFKRLFGALNKAAVKLADDDSIFRDTLIGNILEAVEAIDSLNLTDDPRLKELAQDVREVFEGVSPNDLRKDKEFRKHTADETRQVLDKMKEFF